MLVVAAWLLVLRGLWFAPFDPRPEFDLDAGARLNLNVLAYYPALGLSLVFLGLLLGGALAGLLARAVMVVASCVPVFSLWMLTVQEVVDHRAGLVEHLLLGAMLSALALLLAAATTPSSAAPDPETGLPTQRSRDTMNS